MSSKVRLFAVILPASLLAGCVGAGQPPGSAPYPKFSDIPLAPTIKTSASQSASEGAVLRDMGVELAGQAQTVAQAPTDADALAAARALAAAPAAPSDADLAAEEAFARAARARATPPPPRK